MKTRFASPAVLTGLLVSLIFGVWGTPAFAEILQKTSQRTLSFADRVAYQYAIEEVYWRDRIWPKENPQPKPSLDAVLSQAQVEKKVEDYLRNSQLLADEWQKPITSEQLQAEIDRMASHTKQPDVLREVFAALRNDPFLIAECLARPILTERLVRDQTDLSNGKAAGPSRPFPSARPAVPPNQDAYKLPEISAPLDCMDNWVPTNTIGAPDARGAHTAVWTGGEMIVWGGFHGTSVFNTGGRYNPSTDSWAATSITNAPDPRLWHTAVWTGTEMIVWGGGQSLNTGGRYNPITDSWVATSTTNAPQGRYYHTAVWTGSEMIVWGGYAACCGSVNTGGRYNPSTDSWTATSTTGAPERRGHHTAVWSGNEMIVWGGLGNSSYLNTGGRYDPITDHWTGTSLANAPTAREYHTAVWTGSEMIIWGGFDNNNALATGGRYNPSIDSWTATSTTGAPTGRQYHTAVWTSNEMIIWGGVNILTFFSTGGRYNPSVDSWTATSTIDAPTARGYQTAVWTSSEMIVWGGRGSSGDFNTGGRYCGPGPGPTTLTITKAADAPSVNAGSQIGFVVNLMNTGEATAVGLSVGDNLPGGPGINWTIDSPNTSPGWVINGSPPNQSLVYAPNGLAAGASTIAHVVSNTIGPSCGTYSNTAAFASTNGGSGQASASTTVVTGPPSAKSRKTHGAAGNFDVDLPLSGPSGIECRSGGTTSDYAIVLIFAAAVTVNGTPQAAVTSGVGTVGSDGQSNGGMVFVTGNTVTIPLTNVANAQTISVTVFGVNCGSNFVIPMSLLIGDVNGNGTVSAADVALTKSQIGRPVNQTNFRADVSAGGSINATDVSIVKSNVGTGLP
jgi:uncharacterized repeat protein (TIGR01451 family)